MTSGTESPRNRKNSAIPGINDLFTLFPRARDYVILAENEDVDFEHLTPASKKVVNWTCPDCGRKWSARVFERIRTNKDGSKRFCECLHRVVKGASRNSPTVSDLQFMKRLWDNEKNIDLNPSKLSYGSNKKAAWKCPDCGYSWVSTIWAIYIHSGRCPRCESNFVIHSGKTDLFTLVPEAKEYYDYNKNAGIDITSIGVASQKKLWWKCPKCGKETFISVVSKVKKQPDGSYHFNACSCHGKGKANTKSNTKPKRKANYANRGRQKGRLISEIDFLKRIWDNNNNLNLNPNELTANSRRRANWHCPDCGYSWNSTISNAFITSGRCPVCVSRATIMSGINDVLSLVPEANRYYNFEKNAGIDISSLGVASSTEVWWRCPDCGNETKTQIKSKITKSSDGTYRIRSCNKCYGNLRGDACRKAGASVAVPVSKKENLMKFWDWENNQNLDPEVLSSNSDTKANLKCHSCGYSWKSKIRSLTRFSGKCPCCETRRVVIAGITDLFTLVPEAKQYYNYEKNKDIDISQLGISSKVRVWWKCPDCGEEAYVSIEKKVKKTKYGYHFSTCKKCFGKGIVNDTSADGFDIQGPQLDYGDESLAVLHPDIAKLWSPRNKRVSRSVTPSHVSYAIWVCQKCDSEFNASVVDMVNGNAGCPFCNNIRVQSGVNSLEDKHPDIAKHWSKNNFKASNEVLATSSFNALWICPICNGEYNAPVRDMVAGNAECPFCADRRPLAGHNSLADKFPHLNNMWASDNDKSAADVLPSSLYDALWICPDCGGEYDAPIRDMVDGTVDCPYCTNRRVLPGFNSLAVKHPNLLQEWDYIRNYSINADPDSIFERNQKAVWWKCNNGHKYRMSVHTRVLIDKRHKVACSICKGRRREIRHFI